MATALSGAAIYRKSTHGTVLIGTCGGTLLLFGSITAFNTRMKGGLSCGRRRDIKGGIRAVDLNCAHQSSGHKVSFGSASAEPVSTKMSQAVPETPSRGEQD